MKFTYSSGQRPLDGFTVKRGIGHGGFGEVYFGLSDAGKEVALKVVQRNADVELRGMGQCLNFKHPNLVELYDIRSDAQGNHWVIMEYVGGESLNTILSRHPNGLDPELVRQWFAGLASAVAYLHDRGVVHRDLKPGNVFVENGTVKVGDYGLCKFISSSERDPQTQSVGTVHYMAPEISSGNYNKQIDVYAAGVMLYEMLTGRAPYEGETAGEILMKHLTTPADLSRVPSAFRPVLHRALAKNPAHRHRTMLELAREVEAAGRDVVQLPVVQPPVYQAKEIPVPPPPIPRVTPVVIPVRTRVLELCTSLLLAAVLVSVCTVLLAAVTRTTSLTLIGRYFFLGLASTWAVLLPAKVWTRRVSESLSRRAGLMALGLLVGVLAMWLDGHDLSALVISHAHAGTTPGVGAPVPPEGVLLGPAVMDEAHLPVVACYLSYFGIAFFGLRWWQLADRRRAHRFSLYAVFTAGLLGLFLMFLWPGTHHAFFRWPGLQDAAGLTSLVMAAAVVQLVSPWEQPISPRPKKLRLPLA